MNLDINKIRKNSSVLFLSIFLGFLTLSFSHSHNFDIKYGIISSLTEKPLNDNYDFLLDSSFNCKIHTFNNNIKFEKSFTYSDEKFFLKEKINYTFHFYRTTFLIRSQDLRAPPEYLV